MGDSIELECHMTGSAPIKVTWSKDHKDIRSGGNYKISCVENTAHLTILKADKGDTGRYFCHASNDMGKDSCSSDVTVKGTGLVLRYSTAPSSKTGCDDLKLINVSLCFQSVKILLCSPKSPPSTSRTWRENW